MASSIRISRSDEDRTRFFRLSLVIIEKLTQILRDLLLNEISPTQIYEKVKQSNCFQKLRQEQRTVISDARNRGYQDFDITLLYTLLRNVCQNISPPSQNWGSMPSSVNEITVGDDIERIRFIRNQVYGHISEVGITETEFKEYWSTISGICTRMQTLLNKDYVKKLQDAKECTLDADTDKKYLELFKRLADESELTSKEIIKIEARVAEKERIVENLIDTSISILNEMAIAVHVMTSKSDIQQIYDSIDDHIRENKEPKNWPLQNLFKKLREKRKAHAEKQKAKQRKILENFHKFCVRMLEQYNALVECSKSSIVLLVTCASKSGYVLYKKDLENGQIGEQLMELFLFPPFLGSFDLKEDDIEITLNGRLLTKRKDLDYLKTSAQEENVDQKDQSHLSHVNQKRPECKSHKNICEMYCTDCHEPTCATCVIHGHKKHDISQIDDIIKRFIENIIADINKREKTLASLHLDSGENESLQAFNDALSAIEDHENMICDEVRKYSSQLKDEVEKQKKQYEGKTKMTHSVKEKIEKELREGIEMDKSILQSNDADKILNYQPKNRIIDWPKNTEAPSVKFLPGQVGQKELQCMFGKIQIHYSIPWKPWYSKMFH